MKKLDYYDIDIKAADKALKSYKTNVDTYINTLEKQKNILITGKAEKIAGMEARELEGKNKPTEYERKVIQSTADKIDLLQTQIDGLNKLKDLADKFMIAFKNICNNKGLGKTKEAYTQALDNFIQQLKNINAFRTNTQMQVATGGPVLWNKIEPRMALKLLAGNGDIALEGSLAGAPIVDPTWGVTAWSTDIDSPVNQFWSRISEEFVNATPPGSDVKAYVFEKIAEKSVLEATELPRIQQKIERKEINSVKLYKTIFYNNANLPVYCINGDLPDIKDQKGYIFQLKNDKIQLHYLDNGIAQPLSLDKDMIAVLEAEHKIDFKELIVNTAKSGVPLTNDSPTAKISTLLDAKKENKIFYLDSLPKDLSDKKYENAFIIVKPQSGSSEKFHSVFFVENKTLKAKTLSDPKTFESLLQGVSSTRYQTIEDNKPSVYHHVRAIIAKNPGHDRYNGLQIPKTPIEIRTSDETKAHVASFAWGSPMATKQTPHYRSQKVRDKLDKFLASTEFRNHSVFRAVLTFTPSKMDAFIKEHQIDVNRANKTGWTPLLLATLAGNHEMVKTLLAHGADCNKATRIGGFTPLMIAVRDGHSEIVKTLVAADTTTKSPKTPVKEEKISEPSAKKPRELGIKKASGDITKQQIEALTTLSTVTTQKRSTGQTTSRESLTTSKDAESTPGMVSS